MGITVMQPRQENLDIPVSAIHEQLELLLAWHGFQNSRRYPKFLKYIVEKAILGAVDELRERVIGCEVFGRSADYEPASDPIVRLVAGETRKRLAQYYLLDEHKNQLRVEIPPGSYVPLFFWPAVSSLAVDERQTPDPHPDSTAATAPPVSADDEKETKLADGMPWWRWLKAPHQIAVPLLGVLGLALIAGLLLGSIAFVHGAPRRNLNSFWKPILSVNAPTVICIGDWSYYRTFSSSSDQFVGPYDLAAMARLAGMLNSDSHPFSILMSSNVTLTDLRQGSGILIGASNNAWTPTILSQARFQYHVDPKTANITILDMQAPDHHNSRLAPQSDPATGMSEEFGLISRVKSPTTGQVELVVGGSRGSATVAASEFITNPEYFQQFTDQAPSGWQQRNLQIVVVSTSINGRPGPPRLLFFDLR